MPPVSISVLVCRAVFCDVYIEYPFHELMCYMTRTQTPVPAPDPGSGPDPGIIHVTARCFYSRLLRLCPHFAHRGRNFGQRPYSSQCNCLDCSQRDLKPDFLESRTPSPIRIR